MHHQPPHRHGDGGQGRGRAKGGGRGVGQGGRWSNGGRDNRGLNGGAGGGSLPGYQPARWQRPGAVRHPSEDQDTRPQKNKELNQEPMGMVQDARGMNGSDSRHTLENQGNGAVGEGSRSAAGREHYSSETRERRQRGRKGADWNLCQIDPQQKRTEPKPCRGPFKSAKPLPQKQSNSDRGAGGEERVQGRSAPLQNREQERGNMPKNKETQTACWIEQLSEEKYECMVCCDVIGLMAPVWSCQICYHVFHLKCIRKWARSSASQAEDSTEGWRCPACQNVVKKHPTSYICFCGKVTNPEWQRSEIPHSCGDMCGKKRGVDCNHRCNILCHPGPCPQCPAFVTKSCVCGRTTQPMRCGQAAVVQCDRVCGAVLNCAEHTCVQVCHGGTCQPCQLLVQQVCYCGNTSCKALCGAGKEEFDGSGHFSCQRPCGRILDCDAHRCEQVCHPGPCQPCPLSPRMVKTCSCGQTPLAKLLELGYSERETCSDPIPSCGKTCRKPLACGSNDTIHICEMLCHAGRCGPCSLTSTITCRCGSKTKEVPCETINNEDQLVFSCGRRCNKKRTCGRHKCGELCCVNVEHGCTQICGYKLNCGIHHCQEPCHRGHCERCLQSSFDELTCHCGQTVLYPPIACGTEPPDCKNPCTRRHGCDHPVFHNCHSEEKCPPCTHLTQKWCRGKHEQRSNIACHLQDISCGLPCDKVLLCKMHRCKHICHRGECLSEGICHRPCPLPRPECGHPCSAPCHTGSSCPHNSCTAKVALQCHCGRRKKSVACTEATNSYQKYAAIAMASKLSDMLLGESVDIGQLITKRDVKQIRLECDQECATLERNRLLAEALQIDLSVDPFNVRSTSTYSDNLKEVARKDLKFVSEVEEKIRNVVKLANEGKQQKRSHCFPPMNQEHRKIVHELAKAYGAESVCYDSEPKRNVVITAHKGMSVCPNSTLTFLIEREGSRAHRAPPPIAHIKQHSSKADSGSYWSKMVQEEPVIDYFDVQD